MSHEPEFQVADPIARRNAIAVWGVCVILGAAVLLGVQSVVDDPTTRAEDVISLLEFVAGTMSVLLLVAAIWLLRVSQRVFASGRFPPPGTRVVRDTRVLTGTRARTRAWIGVVVAVVLVAGGCAVPWLVRQLAESLARALEALPK